MESMQRRKPSAMFFDKLGRKKEKANLKRRPTLRHFLEECNERRRFSATPFGAALAPERAPSIAENFRLQQKYWGRVRSSSFQTSDSDESKSSSNADSDVTVSDTSLDDFTILRRLRSRSLRSKFEGKSIALKI